MANLFEEIDKEREDLPKINSITKEVSKRKLNTYQVIAVVTFMVLFCIGIILGNVFPACGSTSGLYSNCSKTEFNISLTIFSWFCSFLGCLFFYALGDIISLLTSINNKLSKK